MASHIRGVYGIVDMDFRPELTLEAKVEAFLAGGAQVLQLRGKELGSGELLRRAIEVRRIIAGRALFILNDRPDVALAADADGVHVGEHDLPVDAVRRLLGTKLVGATVRTLDEARQAALAGADYVGFGPVFPTTTKALAVEARGLDLLAEVAAGSPVPVVAIGGMSLDRAEAVGRSGAAALALVSGVLAAADPARQARLIGEAFARGRAS